VKVARVLGASLAGYAACFWLALLLLGSWSGAELVAAAGAAALATVALAVTLRLSGVDYRLRLAWLRSAAGVPWRVVVDFGILVRVLAVGPRRGRFRAKPFDVGPFDARRPTGPVSAGRRAFVGAAAGYSPNAYVVELDPERQLVLTHVLVPDPRSESPA
jgi:hypothetical protein